MSGSLASSFSRHAQRSLSILQELCLRSTTKVEETLRLSGVLGQGKQLSDFLEANRLASRGESVFGVLERTTQFLAEAGSVYQSAVMTETLKRRFLHRTATMEVVLGSPILTNAGRRDATISACAIPRILLSDMSRDEIAEIIGTHHRRGMGTGFSLDDAADPVDMVKTLNEIAISEVQRGEIERSCGNMGVLSVNHPRVMDYVRVRLDNPEIREWKFNLSVNLSDSFMQALNSGSAFTLADGSVVDPTALMHKIAENAHATGDPGVIFMDRINQLNRLPHIGDYKTVVPCGEVSLYAGEVCQFSYINLAAFAQAGQIDLARLRSAVATTVVLLDNAVEANIARLPYEESSSIVEAVRRIGVGVCGFAETLQIMGLPYDSEEGQQFGADIMALINYESKMASVELAKERGPFPAFNHPDTRQELFIEPFAVIPSTLVSDRDWQLLDRDFRIHGIRNLATTILPPTGRSSMFAGVTGSIEPPFRLVPDQNFRATLKYHCGRYGCSGDLQHIYDEVRESGSIQGCALPAPIKHIFKTALELTPASHIAMAAAFQRHVDEGISKTVNLPSSATVDDVAATLLAAYTSKLKGITVYRDGCRQLQPLALGSKRAQQASEGKIMDDVFGALAIEGPLWTLMQSKMVSRLKGVHQNGVNYLIDHRQATSRFQHSVGVMSLVRMLGGSQQEQIAALLHDVGHTAFSHVIDLAFGTGAQDYHEQVKQNLLNTPDSLALLQACDLTIEQLDKLSVPLIKGRTPFGLSADRIDYCIRDLKCVNRIFQPEYSAILNNLTRGVHGDIECKNLASARLLFRKFLEVNQEVYFDPKAEVAGVTLATILQRMVEEGQLHMGELFLDESTLIERIRQSRFRDAFDAIGTDMRFTVSETATPYLPATRKLRYMDPSIANMEGVLTDHCSQSHEELARYLQTATVVYYDIEALEKC